MFRKRNLFVMMIGFSLSGKTRFVKQLLRGCYEYGFKEISSRNTHDDLNKNKDYQDDNTVNGKYYRKRQLVTVVSHIKKLFNLLLKKENIVLDSCNLSLKKRVLFGSIVRLLGFSYQIVYVFVNTDQFEIMDRVMSVDKKQKSDVWMKNYRLQKSIFSTPREWESDYLIEVEKPSDIAEGLRKIKLLV